MNPTLGDQTRSIIRFFFVSTLLLTTGFSALGQVTIYSEDFSGYPNQTQNSPGLWTAVGTDCDDPGLNNNNQFGTFTGINNGTFNISDVEGAPCGCSFGGGGNDNSLTTVPIDISGFCDVMVSLDVAASGSFECDSPVNPIFGCDPSSNSQDQIYVEYELDGAPAVQGFYICGSTGVPAPPAFANFSFNVPDGTSLVVRIYGACKANSETYFLDNLLVEGDNSATPINVTLSQTEFCDDDGPFALPPTQNGTPGTWSGTGVIGSNFNPSSVTPGMYTLTFTPNPPSCELPGTIMVEVIEIPSPAWTVPVACVGGDPVTLDPDPGAGQNGTWTGTGVVDNGDGTGTFNPSVPGAGSVTYTVGSGACTDQLTQFIPLSTLFIANQVGPICDDNGTPSDPSDDTFTYTITVGGANVSPSWTANDPNMTTGSYATPVTFGPYPISGGAIAVTITDNSPIMCTTDITLNPGMPCSDECTLDAANLVAVACNDNGTPFDDTDDFITFLLNPTGQNVSTQYTVTAGGATITPANGVYGAPFPFQTNPGTAGGGDLILTITDANDPTCSLMAILPDPGVCSSSCSINAVPTTPICNDNGTPSDPSDDTFIFQVTVTGINNGASWSADDPNSTVGTYNTGFPFGPYPISGGDLSFTITDAANSGCTTSVMVGAPATCSNQCTITHLVENVLCDNNGTSSDPSDDTFTFDLIVSGNNTAGTWTANDPSATAGAYDTPVSVGPFNIADGTVSFTVTDNNDPACTTAVSVVPPATCSDQCGISAILENAACDDNGTPSDPSDDLFTIDVTVTGANTGANWMANDPNMTTGNYGVPTQLGPYNIADGSFNILIQDSADPACDTNFLIVPPNACSGACSISTVFGTPVCDDNGTPTDPSDDTFTIEVTISGQNTTATWIANDPNGTTGPFNSPVIMGPYAIANGQFSVTFTDGVDLACATTELFTPPATCSDECGLSVSVANILCNAAGTPSDATDDLFTFAVTVTGTNNGSGWTANDPNNSFGAYDAPFVMGTFPIAGGPLTITFTDDTDPTCTVTVTVDPPTPCSGQCSIGSSVSNIQCNDEGTPSDPSDDTYSFEVTVNGSNTGATWTADDPNATTGNYGANTILGPYPISGGDLSFTITDVDDPACTTPINVTAPATCSDLCVISATISQILCNDNGTPSDPSDDTFTLLAELTGANVAGGWIADDPNVSVGNYDVQVPMGPYPISGGDLTITFSDLTDPTCTTTEFVAAPATCSDLCVLDTLVQNVLCDDNGTPSDPADDTFTFDLTVTGINVGASWTANDPNASTGLYGALTNMGPYPISGGDLTFTIVDAADPACPLTMTVLAPNTCSDLCLIDGMVSNISCNDAGTPSDPSDDTYTFDLSMMGANTGMFWTADDPNGTSGNYTMTTTFGPYLIADGSLTFTVTDGLDPACTASFTVDPPATCSDLCDIDHLVENILCDDAGTPSDPSDDTYMFEVTVTGTNTAANWSANDPNGTTGAFNTAVLFGPYLIADGDLNFAISDDTDPTCISLVNVTAPTTCSDLCALSLLSQNEICDDNGTPLDPSDDVYFVELTVDGFNLGANWTADDPNSTTGIYGMAVQVGPYPIAGGDVTIILTDATDPACQLTVNATAPPVCSITCALTADLGPDLDVCADELITIDATNPACVGCQYEWEDASINPIRSVIPQEGANTYSVTLTDMDGCMAADTIILNGFLPDTTLLVDASCSPQDTGVFVNVLANTLGCDSVIITLVSLLPSDTTFFFDVSCSPLDTGVFVVNLTNQFNCDSLIITTVDLLPSPETAISASICDGDVYDFGGQLLGTSGIYTDVFPAANGCDSTVTLTLEVVIPSTENINETLCEEESLNINGTVYDIDNPAGMELLLSQNGCDSLIINVNLTFSALVFDLNAVDPGCLGDADGSITVENVLGGTGPYTVFLDGSTVGELSGSTGSITTGGLVGGQYFIEVVDANGCSSTQGVFLEANTDPLVDLGEDQTINLGESVTLNAITNLSDPIVTWLPLGALDCTDCLTGTVVPAETTTYAVILVDSLGCSATDEVTINVTKFRDVYFANVFSPDDDGINDVFYIQANPKQVVNVQTFQVYDRWGELVYSGTNLPPNDPNVGWDGRFRGSRAPLGVYVFFAEIEFVDGIVEVFKGDVTLVR